MTDLEFAEKISEQIGAMYRDAKNSCLSRPEYSLSRIRSVINLCCDIIAENRLGIRLPNGLEDKIKHLDASKIINRETRDIFHKLRQAGNKGAHPEEYSLTKEQFVEIAEEALSLTRTILELVFQLVNYGAAIPSYDIEESDLFEMQTLCHQALIEAEPDAMYKVGMHLRTMSQDALRKHVDEAKAAGERWFDPTISNDYHKRSMTMLSLACDRRHPAALYECGVAMIRRDDFYGENKVSEGEILLCRASKADDINAIAWIGSAHMRGTEVIALDYMDARTNLERAAEYDHPEALCNLATIHYDGLGVPVDHKLALNYSLRAARAGYPLAQYNAFVLLSGRADDGASLESAYGWLKQAADAEQVDACFALGQLMRIGKIKSDDFSEVETLLSRAHWEINEATFELAILYHTQGETNGHAILAMYHLQNCYEKALEENNESLANRCMANSVAIVEDAARRVPSMSNSEMESYVIARSCFDERRLPHKNRKEQIQLYNDKMKKLVSMKRENPLAYRRELAKLTNKGVFCALNFADVKLMKPAVDSSAKYLPKIGRNDLCHCGSGRKYKVCCL